MLEDLIITFPPGEPDAVYGTPEGAKRLIDAIDGLPEPKRSYGLRLRGDTIRDGIRLREGVYRNAHDLHHLIADFGMKVDFCPRPTTPVAEPVPHVWADESVRTSLFDGITAFAFGTADNEEQVMAHLAPFINDPVRRFYITLGELRRNPENKGLGGGWRWKKNGTYVGTRTRMADYLDDEPEIDSLVTFHIFEWLDPFEGPLPVTPPPNDSPSV